MTLEKEAGSVASGAGTYAAQDVVLVLGSGPNVTQSARWPRAWFDRIVAINNAWRVRPDWDDLVFPEDFPDDRLPHETLPHQRLIDARSFVPAQNAYGGFVYAGGTMAYTAAYWALHALRPRVMAFLGCDMVYPATGQTHFYGTGTADPLRQEITLRDLGAKSARLALIAAGQGCACVNLSRGESRLVFDRAAPQDLRHPLKARVSDATRSILEEEAALGYVVPSGRYWEHEGQFDVTAIDRIDAQWRRAFEDLSAKRRRPAA